MEALIGEPLDLSQVEIVPISEVRRWAAGRGIPVGGRGHLPESVIREFNRRHKRRQARTNNPSTLKVKQ
jgi:hypothetical protein